MGASNLGGIVASQLLITLVSHCSSIALLNSRGYIRVLLLLIHAYRHHMIKIVSNLSISVFEHSCVVCSYFWAASRPWDSIFLFWFRLYLLKIEGRHTCARFRRCWNAQRCPLGTVRSDRTRRSWNNWLAPYWQLISSVQVMFIVELLIWLLFLDLYNLRYLYLALNCLNLKLLMQLIRRSKAQIVIRGDVFSVVKSLAVALATLAVLFCWWP